MSVTAGLALVLSAIVAPLYLGVIQRTKSLFAGRAGPPIAQTYFDLFKLLRKGAVYSGTTTWVFRLGPIAGPAAGLAALSLLPQGPAAAAWSFTGDFLVLIYLLAAARFFTLISALDTGSSFEGMGASREAAFSALAEPVLLLSVAAAARTTGQTSLSGIFAGAGAALSHGAAPIFLLLAVALVIVLLAENSRIPVDDPSTHLELTMIHEVMVLDHGGPDLALILWGASLKLWILGALIVGLLLPIRTGLPWIDWLAFAGGMLLLALIIGVIESSIARLRMNRVPQFLVGGGAFAVVALALAMR